MRGIIGLEINKWNYRRLSDAVNPCLINKRQIKRTEMKYEIRIGFIIGILTMISILTNAQIKVIDSLTQEYISSVNLYADNGSLLGATNIAGEVVLDSLKQENSSSLTFQHVAYNSMMLPFSVVKTMGKIKMVSPIN